ncbi:MAG: Gfo/Idh/MocA family oxidoreductase [Planctomycetota bacterium]|nr:Gfo/Idh/MocA family oxidoreductase [Planctomycetota bacterium]
MVASRLGLSSLLLVVFALFAEMAPVHAQLTGEAATKPPTKPAAILGPFNEWVASVAFSPDGNLVATGTYDEIQISKLGSPKPLNAVRHKLGRVRCLVFSNDGTRLFAGGFRQVAVLNTTSWKVEQEFSDHRAYVTSMSISPDGRLLATSSEDTTVRLWNLSDGTSRILYQEQDDPVTGVAISPDGSQVAVASGDDTRPTRPGHVRLLNASSGIVVHEFEEHDRAATGVAFSPDGKRVATTSLDEKVKLHSVETGKVELEYDGHSRPTNAVRFLPSGRHVVSVSGGRAIGKNEIHVWEASTGETTASIDSHKGPVFDVAVSNDGSLIASASRDGTVIVWKTESVLGSSRGAESIVAGVANLAALANSLIGKPDVGDKPASEPADKSSDTTDAADAESKKRKTIRIGMIGLDTSHCIAFTKLLNDPKATEDIAGFRVVAVYPKGSPDIESSTSRVPGYIEQMKELGVLIVDDLDALVGQVDAILLETNDGRPHLEQIIPALKAGLPVFVDKPIAGSVTDAIAMFELGRHFKTPLFSASSLRFSEGPQALRAGSIGRILGCSTYSPCSLEKTHPDLFWYGIHGVEMLFTVMGAGCESVTRASSTDFELVTGTWNDGRIGTFRGIRSGTSGYGGTAFGEKGIAPVGKYGGYRPLVVEIVKFFKTRQVPVSEAETLEIYAFMEASDESKRQGGAPVTLESVLKKARAEAAEKVKAILARE